MRSGLEGRFRCCVLLGCTFAFPQAPGGHAKLSSTAVNEEEERVVDDTGDDAGINEEFGSAIAVTVFFRRWLPVIALSIPHPRQVGDAAAEQT